MGQGGRAESQVTQASWWQGQAESGKAPWNLVCYRAGTETPSTSEATPTFAAGRQLQSAVAEAPPHPADIGFQSLDSPGLEV